VKPNRPTIGRAPYKTPVFTHTTRRIPWADQYRHLNWLRLKAAILERDRHKCRGCSTKNRELHVHHRFYARGGYIWDVPHTALITLCSVCHAREHRRIDSEGKRRSRRVKGEC
jgi:5-methylcytosine-specific restriction endonuclease McrA